MRVPPEYNERARHLLADESPWLRFADPLFAPKRHVARSICRPKLLAATSTLHYKPPPSIRTATFQNRAESDTNLITI
jgi:hypothetical protein